MIVSIDGQHFIARATNADELALAKARGFIHNPQTHRIETTRFRIAAGLRTKFDGQTDKLFQALTCQILAPWTSGILLPDTQKLDRYQRLGVLHALERNHSYLAFEQGLGKTPTGVAIINSYRQPAVVLCPPSLIPNWYNELAKWGMGLFVETLQAGKKVKKNTDVLLVPDTMIDRAEYDQPLREFMAKRGCALLVDEAQRFTLDSIRTSMVYGDNPDGAASKDIEVFGGLVHRAPKVVCLSGTPMRNRPIEMYPNLQALAFNCIDYRSKIEYGVRYCGGFEQAFGWNLQGASNAAEWHKKVHNIYLRREEQDEHLKIDKPTEIIYARNNLKPKTVALADAVMSGRKLEDCIDDIIKLANSKGNGIRDPIRRKQLGQIAEYRKDIGNAIATFAIAHIKNVLESTDENLIVGCWHDGVLTKLEQGLLKYHPLVVWGKTPPGERAKRVKSYEAGNTRLFLAKIQTMVGHNLNRADRVIAVESSWSPTDNDQFRFRAMRRGKSTPVLTQYMCIENSLSQYVLERVLTKQKVVNTFINKRGI